METEINKRFNTEHITEKLIAEKLNLLKGKIQQIPPLFSAKSVNGVRAYELARGGVKKTLNPVEVEVFNYDIIDYQTPVLKLKINCSKGTYIRSLARDLGEKVDSGGHLTALKRTAIGDYLLVNAYDFEKFKKKLNIM